MTLFAVAQKEIIPDSVKILKMKFDIREPILEKPVLFDESFTGEEFGLFDFSIFHQPLIPDYTKNLNLKKYLNDPSVTRESFLPLTIGTYPFLTNGNIFSETTYKVSEHFSFGGNSFGAQSIFDQPKLNPAISEMSIKGASMFMQYKFSNNFKVQTRISISNNKSPWEQ